MKGILINDQPRIAFSLNKEKKVVLEIGEGLERNRYRLLLDVPVIEFDYCPSPGLGPIQLANIERIYFDENCPQKGCDLQLCWPNAKTGKSEGVCICYHSEHFKIDTATEMERNTVQQFLLSQQLKALKEKPATDLSGQKPESARFKFIDKNWDMIKVDGKLFELRGRKQIKKALRFLYEKGYTSATRKRATVKAVCRAAGQNALEPNLHAIFHVMKEPSNPMHNYDELFDLAIDRKRGEGVLLKV